MLYGLHNQREVVTQLAKSVSGHIPSRRKNKCACLGGLVRVKCSEIMGGNSEYSIYIRKGSRLRILNCQLHRRTIDDPVPYR